MSSETERTQPGMEKYMEFSAYLLTIMKLTHIQSFDQAITNSLNHNTFDLVSSRDYPCRSKHI